MKKYIIIGEKDGIIKGMGESVDIENTKIFDTKEEAKEVMNALSLEFTLEGLEGVQLHLYEKVE